MSAAAKIDPVRVGEAVIDPAARAILRNGEETRLEPRVFAVLTKLAGNQGKPVSRADLLECWPDGAGSDEALTQAISILRKALGDTRPPQLIRTLSKGGYALAHTTPNARSEHSATPPRAGSRVGAGVAAILDRPIRALLLVFGFATIAILTAYMIAEATRQPPRPTMHLVIDPAADRARFEP